MTQTVQADRRKTYRRTVWENSSLELQVLVMTSIVGL